jgi:hypothetical protein
MFVVHLIFCIESYCIIIKRPIFLFNGFYKFHFSARDSEVPCTTVHCYITLYFLQILMHDQKERCMSAPSKQIHIHIALLVYMFVLFGQVSLLSYRFVFLGQVHPRLLCICTHLCNAVRVHACMPCMKMQPVFISTCMHGLVSSLAVPLAMRQACMHAKSKQHMCVYSTDLIQRRHAWGRDEISTLACVICHPSI